MQRILLVKIGALGDIIMALHALHNFRNKGWDADVTWLVSRSYSSLVKESKLANSVIEVDEARLFAGSKFNQLQEVLRVQTQINRNSYDLVAIGNRDPRYRILRPFRRTHEFRQFGHGDFKCCPRISTNYSVEYFRLLAGSNSANPLLSFDYFKMPLSTVHLAASKPQIAASNQAAKKIVIFPGAAKNSLKEEPLRRWPIVKYLITAQRLIQNNFEVIVAGGREDDWVVEHFQGIPIVNKIGQTSLFGALELIRSANAVVVHDSGPLHLATLTDTPIVALFGPVEPRARILLAHFNGIYLWNPLKLACAPCYDGKHYPACQDNQCLTKIDPTEVVKAVKQLTS